MDLYVDVTMIPIGCKAQLSRHIEIVSILIDAKSGSEGLTTFNCAIYCIV